MKENEKVIRLAEEILDIPFLDPDADEVVLARQFLRARERINILLPMAKAYAHEHNVGNNMKMVQEIDAITNPTSGSLFASDESVGESTNQ